MAADYQNRLYLLAFDHRHSFLRDVFGIEGRIPTSDERKRIEDAKRLISEAFALSLLGTGHGACGVLVDEEYGAEVARRAVREEWILAMPVEASGRDLFEFEYGASFDVHVEAFDPTFAKVLIRFNPEDPESDRRAQLEPLARLSDWLRRHDRNFMFELLVPPTPAQMAGVANDRQRFDDDIRPALMAAAITEIQDFGVEPDVWKLEGLDRRDDCVTITRIARRQGREQVTCVVLGRGASLDRVEHWLRTAAGVDGYVGFAIGRTIWFDPLVAFLKGTTGRDVAIEAIATSYLRCVDVYEAAADQP